MDDEKKIWLCPADNTYNSGNFCIRCGRARVAAETAGSEAEAEAPAEHGEDIPAPEKKEPVLTPALAETAESPEVKRTRAKNDRPRSAGTFSDSVGEKVKELCGDVAAHFSRMELVQDIKTDKKNRNITIAAATGLFLALFLIFALLIAPRMGLCILGHRWSDADCTNPRLCTVCGKEKGERLPHDYAPATCTQPATCRVCGAVSGEALGHAWQSATCTEPETCARCGEHNGENLGHIPGETRISVAPTVLEPGEEELLCSVCGEVIENRPCELQNYIDDAGYVFTILDYSKLLVEARENILPEVSMLTYTDVTESDCLAFWLGSETAGTERAATCVFYDQNIAIIPVVEENYGEKPFAVRWSFAKAWDVDTVRKMLPYILSTFSPSPIDGETLLSEKDMTVDGLRYIYENNGYTCRLTVLSTKACENESAASLFY